MFHILITVATLIEAFGIVVVKLGEINSLVCVICFDKDDCVLLLVLKATLLHTK